MYGIGFWEIFGSLKMGQWSLAYLEGLYSIAIAEGV